jgi:hypothetical protein
MATISKQMAAPVSEHSKHPEQSILTLLDFVAVQRDARRRMFCLNQAMHLDSNQIESLSPPGTRDTISSDRHLVDRFEQTRAMNSTPDKKGLRFDDETNLEKIATRHHLSAANDF